MTKKILITGGAGFIGSHTADLLLQNNMSVTVLDNLSTGRLSNLNLTAPLLRVVQGDVLDYPAVLKEVAQCDAILHLAALPSVPKSIDDPIQAHAVNMTGFLHVLQAIREVEKPIRLVYASSSAIYGDTSVLPCSDDSALEYSVLSPYALQKTQNEQYANLYAKLFNIQSLALRYFNVYGERQDPQSVYSGVISRFMAAYNKRAVITIFGDGEQSRDFIHVHDIARANVLALQSDYSGVLNIATGIPETLRNLVAYIEAAGDEQAQVQYVAPRLGDIRASYAKVQKAEESIEFFHEISLRVGIGQLILQEDSL